MKRSEETRQSPSAADIAYRHAVDVCERLVAELDKEIEKCITQETIENQ